MFFFTKHCKWALKNGTSLTAQQKMNYVKGFLYLPAVLYQESHRVFKSPNPIIIKHIQSYMHKNFKHFIMRTAWEAARRTSDMTIGKPNLIRAWGLKIAQFR